jgi:hypothetical protein
VPAIFNLLYPSARALLGGDALSYQNEVAASSADPNGVGACEVHAIAVDEIHICFEVMVPGGEFRVTVGNLPAARRR